MYYLNTAKFLKAYRLLLKASCAVLLLLLSNNCLSQDNDFKIVGYYPLRSAQENPKDVPWKYVTHLNLWFLNPDSAGVFPVHSDKLKAFIDKGHKKGVKILFSIGGGSKQAQYKKLLQDEYRSALVLGLVDHCVKWNADGIDVDLEGSDIDHYYEAFVTELGAALHARNKLLTAAIAVYYKDQFTDKALAQFDFVNVMSYDRTGPWRPDKPGPHAPYQAAVDDLNYFGNERNIPKQKMTLGVPFYGYGYGPNIDSKAISMNYREITTTYPGSEEVDEWKRPDGMILYYNGAPTMRKKVELAKKSAGGIMIWQLRGDAEGRKSLLRLIDKTK